jgi:transcriptional accessory protein Tex/SPT6
MANLRVIKKDIDYLVSEVISDCWTFLYINQGKNSQEAVDVINEAVELRNSLYERVNHPDKENMKAHYKAVNKDLLTEVDTLFNKISNLVGGVK